LIETNKKFKHFADSEKQQVLLDFVNNKAVLNKMYEVLFSEQNLRASHEVVSFEKRNN
jgi:hypothetical protein